MTKKSLKTWITLFSLCVFTSFFTTELAAQNTFPPEQLLTELERVAPNRPAMERTTSDIDIFYAGPIKYKYSENEKKINTWRTNHPEEFKAYSSIILPYMENTSALKEEDLESDTFTDLKAQWALIFNNQ